jgi:hypothetical protein
LTIETAPVGRDTDQGATLTVGDDQGATLAVGTDQGAMPTAARAPAGPSQALVDGAVGEGADEVGEAH